VNQGQDSAAAPRQPWLPRKRAAACALALIVLLGAGARLWRVGGPSLWMDEATSVYLARLQFATEAERGRLDLAERVALMARHCGKHDLHPPGYQCLLLLALEWLGASEAAARAPSALAGIVSVALLYCLASTLYGRAAGLVAAALGAASAHLVFFSRDARLHSLLACLTLGHACLLVSLVRAPRPSWRKLFAYALVGAACLWTYLPYGMVIAGHWLFWGLYASRSRKNALRFALAQVVMCASVAPWIPVAGRLSGALRQRLAENPEDERPLTPGVVAPALLDMPAGAQLALSGATPALAPSAGAGRLVFAEADVSDSYWLGAWPVWAMGGAAMLVGCLRRGEKGERLWPLLLVPVAAALAMPAPRVHVFEVKHVAFAVPLALAAVAAHAAAPRGLKSFWLAAAAVLLVVNVSGLVRILSPSFEKEPWRAALRLAQEQGRDGDIMLFEPEHALAPYFFYVHKAMPPATARTFADAERRGRAGGRVWLVELENPVSHQSGRVFAWLSHRWQEARPSVVFQGYLGAIRVTLFERPDGAGAKGGAPAK